MDQAYLLHLKVALPYTYHWNQAQFDKYLRNFIWLHNFSFLKIGLSSDEQMQEREGGPLTARKMIGAAKIGVHPPQIINKL